MAAPIIITKGDNFRIEVEVTEKVTTLRPVGTINEDVNFGSVSKFLGELPSLSTLQVDLSQVININSCGVREWLLFMERTQPRLPVQFSMVNETFIEQASVVPNLLGKAGTRIAAFEIPYFCASCNERTIKVFETKDINLVNNEFSAPEVKCEKCSSKLDFDALEEEYFSFLKHSRGPKS
jgi:hypothetical protein